MQILSMCPQKYSFTSYGYLYLCHAHCYFLRVKMEFILANEVIYTQF